MSNMGEWKETNMNPTIMKRSQIVRAAGEWELQKKIHLGWKVKSIT